MISKIKGTQDLLDLTLKNFILEQTKKFLDRYNFSEIETPILEPTKLFIRSLGQDTDVVSKEMYIFDKEKKDSACLRPEATASTTALAASAASFETEGMLIINRIITSSATDSMTPITMI